MTRTFRVVQVDWAEASASLMSIRQQVFVQEQSVPLELEQDGLDPECVHVLAEDLEGRPIGTGRMRNDGRIGRMAVLAERRGGGVGAAILQALCDAARARGLRELELHAQTSAQAFYERAGWRAHGEVYLEAGIPHVDMRKRLA